MNLIANIFGIFAFMFYIISIQCRGKGRILINQLISNLLYGLQYVCLYAFSAGIMNFIATGRCFIFYLYDKKKSHVNIIWLIVFLSIILVSALFTVSSPIHIIPVLICILYTVSTYQDNLKILRVVFIICGFIWIYYNIHVEAYTALIGNVFEIISGVVSLVRFRGKEKNYSH